MTNRLSLLGGAGLGALLIAGMAGPALAQSAPARAASQSEAARDAEIDALRAQIAALNARLDAQEAAQKQTAADAQAAQAKAAEVGEQQAALKTAPAGAPKWFDNTSISGRMYFNASSIDRKVDGQKTESDGGFLIKRFYLGVDHKFDDVFSGNITTDIDSVVGTNGSAIGKGLYVKKAFLQAKLDKALTVRLGSADLPWVPFVEGLYGYRHIENVVIDRTKFGTSADWGVHVFGDIGDGLISYAVSAVDGGGYRNPTLTKTVDLEGRVSAQYKGFVAGVGGYTGKLGKNVQGATTFHTATRLDAVLAYKTDLFSAGGEYFHTSNWTQVTSPVEDKANGYSLFASVRPMDKVSVFGRYDWVKPHKDTRPDLKEHYFNVGVQYSPAKIVDLALVYKRDKAENGFVPTSNGTIGGAIDGTYDEIGLFGQFRF